jgi:transposase
MRPFAELTHFGALDFSSDHHDVVVLDSLGARVVSFRFPESAAGWADFRQRIRKFPALGCAIETSRGWVIERLLEAGVDVYPVAPQKTKAYRERHRSSGACNDDLDAFILADALRTDGRHWRPLRPEDELTQKLRLLTRDEVSLIEERTAKVLQLKAALHEYYPAALEAFEDWTAEGAWNFLLTFPTPQVLQAAGRRRHEKFLHTNHLAKSRELYDKRLEIFSRATDFCGSPAACEAKSLLAVSLAKLLRQLELQLKEYRKRIEDLFGQHPDHFIFESLPHAGPKLQPRLLSELGTHRDHFPDASSLQCFGGTAPVTEQSGKQRWVHFRRGCCKSLRHAVHLWAAEWLIEPSWGQVYYQQHRDKGCSHADALRRLGHKLLKLLWRVWYDRKPYDAGTHYSNQLKHGSWILKLAPNCALCPPPKTGGRKNVEN